MWVRFDEEKLREMLNEHEGQDTALLRQLRHVAAPKDSAYKNYEAQIIQAAERKWASDDIEIDTDGLISEGGDPGAWVMAWVWVYDREAGIPLDDEDEEDCDGETSL